MALNFLHPDGRVVDERFVDMVAAEHGISIRTGCFCNPGAGEAAFSLSHERLLRAEFGDETTVEDFLASIGMATGGAVSVSLGLATNFADVYRFMAFAAQFRDLVEIPDGLPARLGC